MKTVNILGIPIAAINMNQAAERIEEWIRQRQQAYVTVTGVHGIMESQQDGAIRKAYLNAGMCVPDGMPMVWIGRLYGHKEMGRVYGPDLMLEMMRRSVEKNYSHYFYGGKPGVPERLRDCLLKRFPGLTVSGVHSPPFRAMSEEEENQLADAVGELSPDIFWVGLGAPKQERWMAAHIGKLNTRVLIGVGAAFDFHAGLLRQAPRWIRQAGLEWLFRLCVEPKRLWRRYLKNNPKFIWMMFLQFLGLRK